MQRGSVTGCWKRLCSPRLPDSIRAGLLLLAACTPVARVHPADARTPIEATINGQSVHLVFDTAATDMVLFRRTADRLNLKSTQPSGGLRPPPGMVVAGWTEPCDFVFQAITAKVQFAVVEMPAQIRTDIEGALPWFPFKDAILVVNADRETVSFANSVPDDAKSWTRFDPLTNSRVLGFKITTTDSNHNCVYVDTGDPGGVNLNSALWKNWAAGRTNSSGTVNASYSPATGVTVSTQQWAEEFTLGALTIRGVPIEEQIAAYTVTLMPNHAATFGMYALRRLNLIVDGSNGVVYAQPSEKPPPPYPHNRAGAVFVPQDFRKDGPLFAHVVPGGPAFLAGVRDGDVLLKVDETDLTRWLTDPQIKPNSPFREWPAGTILTLTLKREDRELKAAVVLKNILGP